MFCSLHRRSVPRLMAGVLLSALPLLAQAGQSGSGPIPLRMKYRLGEVDKYQSNMSISVAAAGGPKGAQGGGPMQQVAVFQEFKTSKLLPNGSAEVLVTTKNMMGGAGMGTMPPQKPVTLVMDARGAVRATKGAPGTSTPSMFGNMLGSNALGTQQMPLPEKPVKPGDTWSNSLPITGMGTGSVKGTFVKIGTVGKHRTALLHYVLTIPVKFMMDQSMQPTQSAAASVMTMSGSVIMNVDNDVDLLGGRLVRSTGNGAMAMTIVSKHPPQAASPKVGGPVHASIPTTMTVNTRITLGTTLVE